MSIAVTLANGVLRLAATSAHLALRASRLLRRQKSLGAHAIALTPEGKLVLVKLRYAPGWRVPGGGRSKHEDPADAALRELREEIGMISHGEVVLARNFEELAHFKRDIASLVIVRDVVYRPARWNWEVEQVREFDLGSLPLDMSPGDWRWIETVRPVL